MKHLDRRQFLTGSTLAAGGLLLSSRLALANTPSTTSRFVLIILRGALDGLAAVPPYGDPDYARLRGELALGAPGSTRGALQLDGTFGLHPSLAFMSHSYRARELIVFHAVASPYRERSHFDGQDVLESGYTRPHAVQTGWLNRALAALPADRSRKELGVALGQNVPLVMRGPAPVASWSPSRLAALDDDTLARIADLYAKDPLLSKRLADALAADAIAAEAQSAGDAGDSLSSSMQPAMAASQSATVPAQSAAAPARNDLPSVGAGAATPDMAPSSAPSNDKRAARGAARYLEVVRAAGGFLRRDDGPRIAVFDATGWDTHANEGAAQGQLAARLAALDSGLRTLKEQLGPVWKETAVLIATEFGRTAATNGTRGTDHGTGAAAFLIGGAVQGGRVIADWPGLATRQLYQGRDLQPTLDMRSILKGVLADHMHVPRAALESSVFPDSAGAKTLGGLIA
ncbi:MAG TPA: DUF1501 domain-containing protein [Steroidobacteraceae bacterium]|jgi:uncharacterized protein (DUF1501 family)|nr:DUF1501 domain-containing protein [Steroidobacteraceae bacterium]